MRTSLLLGLSLLIVACGQRRTTLLDGGLDASKPADSAQQQPDGVQPLKLDMGGGSFTYHGRVYLGHGVDPRINMPGWVSTRVGFATAFYESGFSPTQTAGACRLGPMMPPPPGLTHFVDAGSVQVTGGLMPISFTYMPSSYYVDDLKDGVFAFFKGGQTLTVKGTGGPKLQPFSGAVPAPAALKVKTPDLYQDVIIDTSRDYAVTWTASSADRIRVVLSCKGPSGEHRLECDSSDDGALMLPSALLKAIAPKCTFSKQAQIEVIRLNERHVAQGQLRVTLRASTTIQSGAVLQ